jgi:CRISPR/Cas system Type II protein with McrA/HNH and RuvC-like nuclease domain
MLWAMRLPVATARRVARATLRRIERRLGKRIGGGLLGLVWRLAGAIDDRDRLRQGEWDALTQEVAGARQQIDAAEVRLTAAEDRLSLAEGQGATPDR